MKAALIIVGLFFCFGVQPSSATVAAYAPVLVPALVAPLNLVTFQCDHYLSTGTSVAPQNRAWPLLRELAFAVPGHYLYRRSDVEQPGVNIWENSTEAERWAAIADFRIARTYASPDTLPLSYPGLTNILNAMKFGEFDPMESQSSIVLNIVTGPRGRILEIDAWDGNTRLAAFHLSGKKYYRDLDPDQFVLRVNGTDINGHGKKSQNIPLSAIDFAEAAKWQTAGDPTTISATADSSMNDKWAMQVDGRVSYSKIGDHTMIADIAAPTRDQRPGLRVAAFFTNGKGLENLGKLIQFSAGFDQVVVVPSSPEEGRALYEAIAQINKSLESNGFIFRLNLYRGQANSFIANFGKADFINRLSRIYNTNSTILDIRL